ncbi:MAG: ribonuclease P protein component [bacterium]
MLSKNNRLTDKKDFETVFSKGKRVSGSNLGVKYLANKLPVSRFGFVVGTKVSKNAVLRNKIKRRLREITRACAGQFAPGFDVVVSVFPGAKDYSFEMFKNELLKIYHRSGLL